jgi:hypothetical protein
MRCAATSQAFCAAIGPANPPQASLPIQKAKNPRQSVDSSLLLLGLFRQI